MPLKPLENRIIVKGDEAEKTTAGGLFLSRESKEKPCTGLVIAVGPGAKNKDGALIPLPVSPGQRILYEKYGGTEVTYEKETVGILRVDDIIAIIE